MNNRGLDILISKHIFNREVVHTTWNKGKYECYTIGEPDYYYTSDEPQGIRVNDVPWYSTDIEAAFSILEHLETLSQSFEYTITYDYEGLYHCRIKLRGDAQVDGAEFNASSVSEAIVRTVLKAFNIEYKE